MRNNLATSEPFKPLVVGSNPTGPTDDNETPAAEPRCPERCPVSRPPNAQRDAAYADLRAGASAEQIVSKYGVSLGTARRWSAAASGRSQGQRGADRQPRAMHADGKTPQILQLIGQDLSDAQIAEEVGVSRQAVQQVRKRIAKP